MKRGLAVLALFCALAASVAIKQSAPAHAQGSVLIYGDSLIEEARPYLHTPDVATFGGTALCDWIDRIVSDVNARHPRLVVLSFIGNNLTPCMSGYTTRAEVKSKYASDMETLKHRLGPNAPPLLWVVQPETRDGGDPAPNSLYRAEPQHVDAGADMEANGAFTSKLPCLPDEGPTRGCGSNDEIAVRSPDGKHFCPTGIGPCDVYSSGARRFANAIDGAL